VAEGETAPAALWDSRQGKRLKVSLPHVDHAWFSPDGKLFVTAGDKTGRVWSAATGERVGKELRTASVIALAAFTADGDALVTLGEDRAEVWDVKTGERVGTLDVRARVAQWAGLSRDGQNCITIERELRDPTRRGSTIRRYAVGSGALIDKVEAGTATSFVGEGKGGHVLVLGDEDRTVRIVDLDLPGGLDKRIRVIRCSEHRGAIQHVSFSPNGRYVLTGSRDGTGRVWDTAPREDRTAGERDKKKADGSASLPSQPWPSERAGRETWAQAALPLVHAGEVTFTAFSPDGRLLLTAGTDGTARLWELETPGRTPDSVAALRRPQQISCSADGRSLAVVEEGGGVRLCQVASSASLKLPLPTAAWVSSAWLSPDGRLVATAGGGPVRIWDALTGQPVCKLAQGGDDLAQCKFVADGSCLITLSMKGEVARWQARTGIREAVSSVPGEVSALAVGPRGEVALGGGYVIRVWSKETLGEGPLVLKGHTDDVTVLRFSPDGRRLVSGGRDHRAIVWDFLAGGDPVHLLHGSEVTCAAFNHDGSLLVTGEVKGAVRVWKAGTQVGEPLNHGDRVNDVAFDEGGRFVVTASDDQTARVWDVRTGDPVTPPLSHHTPVIVARIGPGAAWVVTVGEDNSTRVWDVVPAAMGTEDFTALARLYSGNELSEAGRPRPLRPRDLHEAWERLAGRRRPCDDLSAWHWREAARHEAEKGWDTALWHLERLARLQPDSAMVRARQGDAHFARGEFKNAQAAYDAALELDRDRTLIKSLMRAYEDIGRSATEPRDARRGWEKALGYYRDRLKADESDEAAKRGAAKACEWLADIELQLGNAIVALKYGRESLAIREALLARNKASTSAKNDLAYAYNWVAMPSFWAGYPDDARTYYTKYLDLREELARAATDDPATLDKLLVAKQTLGDARLRTGDATGARNVFRELVDGRLTQAKKEPSDRQAMRDLAIALNQLGDAYLALDEVSAARDDYERAWEITERLLAVMPTMGPQQSIDLAYDYSRRAYAARQEGDYPEAEKWFQKSVELLKKLEGDQKLTAPIDQKTLALRTRELAAVKGAKQALDDLSFAREQTPREAAADLLILRAITQARQGKEKQAAETAEALRGLVPPDEKSYVENLFDVARCYAAMARAAAKGHPRQELPPDKRTFVDAWAGEAVKALVDAVDHGFADGPRLLSDTDLDIIRGEPAYRDLIARFKNRPDLN
jgi:WD40 repeat protein/tetratricopeptide (TPR) repeat protein